MIELTEQQQQVLREGNPVRLPVPGVGADCVLLRADVYEHLRSVLEDEGPDMRTVALLIEQNMRADDEDDPLLETYQDSGKKP